MPQETGYWNPAVATDKDGKATVTFTVPERSTAWKLLAKGITTETLAGEATDDLAVKKDLFGELKLPLAFTDGDEAEVLASVHNDAVEKGPIEVTLKTTIGGRTVEEKKTIDVTAKGIQELAFKATLEPARAGQGRPGSGRGRREARRQGARPSRAEIDAEFELTVTAGDREDVVAAVVPLLPYGMPVFATASGSATTDTTAWVEPPKDMPLESPEPADPHRPDGRAEPVGHRARPGALVPARSRPHRLRPGDGHERPDGLARPAEAAGRQPRRRQARRPRRSTAASASSVSLLVSSQNDDGGWSWTGRGGASDRYAQLPRSSGR